MMNDSSVTPLGDLTPREEENQLVNSTSEIIHQEQDVSSLSVCTPTSKEKEGGHALRNIGFKTASWQDLVGAKEPEIEFLIEGLLPSGCLIMMGGKPKQGKSLLALLLGISVGLGLPLWGKKVKQGKVLFISTEDSEIRVQKRIWLMLGDPTQHQPDFEFYHGEFILTQKGTLETLKAKVLQTKPDLIILDPLVNLFRGKELNSGEDMNEVLRPLQELAKESKACILVIHHARKSGGDSIDLIQGSITITGVADGLMILRSLNGESDGKRTTLEVLLKDAENPKPVILKRNENLCWEVEGECEEVMGRSLEGDVEEALKNNTEGVTIATLMKMTGTPYKPIYQLLCKLERENKVKSQKFGEYHTKRHFWNDEDKKETNDESQKGESGEKTETENGKSDLGETKSPFSETPSVDNGDWGF